MFNTKPEIRPAFSVTKTTLHAAADSDSLNRPLMWVSTHTLFAGSQTLQALGLFNRLTPNDPYMGRTAPLTSKRFILYIIQQI